MSGALKLNFFQLVICSWGSILILIYRLDAHDLKKKEMRMRSSMNSAYGSKKALDVNKACRCHPMRGLQFCIGVNSNYKIPHTYLLFRIWSWWMHVHEIKTYTSIWITVYSQGGQWREHESCISLLYFLQFANVMCHLYLKSPLAHMLRHAGPHFIAILTYVIGSCRVKIPTSTETNWPVCLSP